MGKAVFTASEIPAEADADTLIGYPVKVAGKEYHITCVSMGNPHAVTFVEDTKSLPLEKIGPEFEHHKMFPDRVNTEFVQVLNRKEVNMRVWERGSGETLACGTGACAVAAACVVNGKTEREITIHLLGGDLLLRYEEDGTVWMTGPAEVVCDGEIDI